MKWLNENEINDFIKLKCLLLTSRRTPCFCSVWYQNFTAEKTVRDLQLYMCRCAYTKLVCGICHHWQSNESLNNFIWGCSVFVWKCLWKACHGLCTSTNMMSLEKVTLDKIMSKTAKTVIVVMVMKDTGSKNDIKTDKSVCGSWQIANSDMPICMQQAHHLLHQQEQFSSCSVIFLVGILVYKSSRVKWGIKQSLRKCWSLVYRPGRWRCIN